MKPTKIFLVRHGESEGNINKNIYSTTPDWKISLTHLGHSQAYTSMLKLSEVIKNEKIMIYSSPWKRTTQTAQYFKNNLNLYKYYEDPRLREQEWGNYQEPHLQQKIHTERKKFGSFFYRMPYGESGADVYDRITTFLDTLHRDFEKNDFPENVLIISHGLTIKTFLTRWFHFTTEWFDTIDTPQNCQIIKMELQHNNKLLINNKYILKTQLPYEN